MHGIVRIAFVFRYMAIRMYSALNHIMIMIMVMIKILVKAQPIYTRYCCIIDNSTCSETNNQVAFLVIVCITCGPHK